MAENFSKESIQNHKYPLLIVFTLLLFVSFAVSNVYAEANTLYVKVRKTALRESPSFLSKSTLPVYFGDLLKIIEVSGDWRKVRTADGKQGYVQLSAVSEQKISFSTGSQSASTGVDEEEIILAGKGFSKNVEQSYASTNRGLNYRAVDAMEKNTISESQLKQFIVQGKLRYQ